MSDKVESMISEFVALIKKHEILDSEGKFEITLHDLDVIVFYYQNPVHKDRHEFTLLDHPNGYTIIIRWERTGEIEIAPEYEASAEGRLAKALAHYKSSH